MERPFKRPRIESVAKNLPGHGAHLPDLERDRINNDLKLKGRFEDIFRKYSKDFDGVGDEIDLLTGKIIVNNGHIAHMRDEQDVGPGNAERMLMSFTADLIDGKGEDEQDQSGSGDESEDDEDEATSVEDDLEVLGLGMGNETTEKRQQKARPENSSDPVSQVHMAIADSDEDELSFIDPGSSAPLSSNPKSRRKGKSPEPVRSKKSRKNKNKAAAEPDQQAISELGKNIALQIAQFMKQHNVPASSLDPLWTVPELPQLRSQIRPSPQMAMSTPAVPMSAGQVTSQYSPLRGATDARYSLWSNEKPQITENKRIAVESYLRLKRDTSVTGTPIPVTLRASSSAYNQGKRVQSEKSSSDPQPLTSDPVLPSSPSGVPRGPQSVFMHNGNSQRTLKGTGRRRRINLTKEQEDLLVKLRTEDMLSWDDILEYFPGLQKHNVQSKFYKICNEAEQELEELEQIGVIEEVENLATGSPLNPTNAETPVEGYDELGGGEIGNYNAAEIGTSMRMVRLSQGPITINSSVPTFQSTPRRKERASPFIKQECMVPDDNIYELESDATANQDRSPAGINKSKSKRKLPKREDTKAKITKRRRSDRQASNDILQEAPWEFPAANRSESHRTKAKRLCRDQEGLHQSPASLPPPAAPTTFTDQSEDDDILVLDSATDLDPEDDLTTPPPPSQPIATPRPGVRRPTSTTLSAFASTPRPPSHFAPPPSTASKISAWHYDRHTRHWSRDSTTTVTTVTHSHRSPHHDHHHVDTTPRPAHGTNNTRERREWQREEIRRRQKSAKRGSTAVAGREREAEGWSEDEGDVDERGMSGGKGSGCWVAGTVEKTPGPRRGPESAAEESEDELAL